jgi:hypothetical protein
MSIQPRKGLAKVSVQVEERDLDPVRRQHPRGRCAKAGRAACDDGRNR